MIVLNFLYTLPVCVKSDFLASSRRLSTSATAWQSGAEHTDDDLTPELAQLVRTQRAIRATDPLDRTVADWQMLVDWNLQRQRSMVVIDPNDPEGLMYLTDPEYRELQKVCFSMKLPLTVIARRGSQPPALFTSAHASFKKSPPLFQKARVSSGPSIRRPTMFRNGLWSIFIRARNWIPAQLKVDNETGAVGLTHQSGAVVWKTAMLWGRQAFHYSGLTRQSLCFDSIEIMGRHMVSILEHQGPIRLIQRLKIYLFVMNNYIGGERMKSTHALGCGVTLRNGLPACFPRRIRDAIRSGSLPAIRWWASFLNMYKALGAKYGEISLSGIQAQPYTGDLGHWSEACLEIWSRLWGLVPSFPRIAYQVDTSRFTLKAGPQGSNLETAPLDAWRWFRNSRNYIAEWLEATGQRQALMDMTMAAQIADMDIWMGNHRISPYGSNTAQRTLSPLGKLAYRLEAAGKIRVFALVDYWTQAVLEPLHSYIFRILKLIPSDATFDQTGRLTSFVRECNEKGIKSFYCYDLKSATDIIPLPLYVELFIPLIGRKLAELWSRLLVDRDFLVSKPPKGGGSLPAEFKGGVSTVRYTRGQPMGALSSWAGLALVHHFLVQFSWIRTGGEGWFRDYLVLGDDIAIASKVVADEYLRVCDEFGIIVGLAKSLVSEIGLINFANQTFISVENISPLSLKEELKARSWSARLALAKRALSRWFPEDKSVMSLLKRILTVPMWNNFQGLTLRGKDYLGLGVVLTLIAQNPFVGASSDKPVGAEEILSWIENYLNPIDSSALARASFIEDLTLVFAREIYSLVDRRLPLLDCYREALWEVSVHNKRHISAGTSSIDSYPHTGWSYIVEKLIHPLLDKMSLELTELRNQVVAIIGFHRNLLPDRPLIDRNHIHGPGVIFKTLGIFQDAEPDFEGINSDFKTVIGLWLRSQALACFGIGTILPNRRVIRDAAREGRFGSLLKGLLPSEHYREQENLKLYGQVTDPNLVKLPVEQLELAFLAHFGQHATLSPIQPVLSREITAVVPAEEKENTPVPMVIGQPATDVVKSAEAQFLDTRPVTSVAKAQPVYSKDGSLERIVGGSIADMMKVALNHSRSMRDIEPIRGSVKIENVELGKPGFGDRITNVILDAADAQEVPKARMASPRLPVLRAGHDYEVPCAPSDVGYTIDPMTGKKRIPEYLKSRQARLPGHGIVSNVPVDVPVMEPRPQAEAKATTPKEETLKEVLARVDAMDNLDDKLAALLDAKRRGLS